MTIVKQHKLKDLVLDWATGAVYSARWMTANAYTSQLINHYEKYGWIERVARGAYKKPGNTVDYTGGLYALQQQDQLKIHAGGLTAMEYHGKAHFLQLGKRPRVTLFAEPNTRLPKWYSSTDWRIALEYYATNLFEGDALVGLTKKNCGEYDVTCSTPARAMLEVCALVRSSDDFEHALRLMEKIHDCKIQEVEALLKNCRSVKAKRLFLYLADHHDLAWLAALDDTQYTLGSGPRQIVTEGDYDPHFRITVPKFMQYENMNNPRNVPY